MSIVDATTAERGENSKRLGQLAQKEFDLWCTRSKLTANGSKEDDEGWDFLVQDKSSLQPRPFLDQEPPAFSAFVQVKGTADASGRFSMTLSNALKLARYHGPAFVVSVHIVDDVVMTAWLFHCSREFIARALAAAVTAGEVTPLNATRLYFTPCSDDSFESGRLREVLASAIGDPREYLDTKLRLLSETGYEDGRFELSIRQKAGSDEEFYDELADLVIGLRDVLVESIDINDVRFGSQRLTRSISNATLRRPPAASDPEATLTVRAGDEEVRLSCRSYLASAYVPFLPPEFNKLRLVSENVEFVVARNPAARDGIVLRWTTTNMSAGVTASDLAVKAQAAKLFRLLRTPGASATYRPLDGTDVELPIAGEFRIDDEAAARYLGAIEHLSSVSAAFMIPDAQLALEPDYIANQTERLQVLAAICLGTSTNVECRFPEKAAPAGVALGDHVGFLISVPLRLRSATLFVVSGVVGRVEMDPVPGMWRIDSSRLPRLAWRLVPRASQSVALELFDQAQGHLESLGTSKVFRPPVTEGEDLAAAAESRALHGTQLDIDG